MCIKNLKDWIKLVSIKCWWAQKCKRIQKEDGVLTAWGRQFFRAGGHWLSTQLTETVPSIKGNSITWWKWTPGLKRKMYFSRDYARIFVLVPMLRACCLLPLQVTCYSNSGQTVSAIWPWQSQALEKIQSTHARRAEVRLNLLKPQYKTLNTFYLRRRWQRNLLRHNSYIYSSLSMMLLTANSTAGYSDEALVLGQGTQK